MTDYEKRYAATWGTPVGQDCIDLDTTLATWVAERLEFMAKHTHGWPMDLTDSNEEWVELLTRKATALRDYVLYRHDCSSERTAKIDEGQKAMAWVASVMPHLWD